VKIRRPVHKRTGLPSSGFLWAYIRRWVDQRGRFILNVNDRWRQMLEGSEFDLSRPIGVNGIFVGIFVRPKNWHNWSDPGPTVIVLRFRDVLLCQDGKEAFAWVRTRFENKRSETTFELDDMLNSSIVDQIRQWIPRLPGA